MKTNIFDKIKNNLTSLFNFNFENSHNFYLGETPTEKSEALPESFLEQESKEKSILDSSYKNIFSDIKQNLNHIKVKYNALINSDIIIREFSLIAKNKKYHAFILFIDGLSDSTLINDFILEPLIFKKEVNFPNISKVPRSSAKPIPTLKEKGFNLGDYIFSSLLPQNSVQKITEFSDVTKAVNMGNCVLFVDTLNFAFDLDVKGLKQRSISKPENELVIRGSQEGFVEVIRTNTSILRRLINNENLIIESVSVGNITKTNCAICYMKNIVNDDLVAEVKYRINNLSIDYLISSGQLEQLIEDTPSISLPQMIATERPDRASTYLLEGRVVIIVNGSPYALVAPAIFIDYLSSPEDSNLKYQFSNLLKFIRLLSLIVTLFLPGLYIAITNFHQDIIPTELLFAIVASREGVPFPILFELLLMEISFELIREASLRIPTAIGPTIGIVGALILGDAAVTAGIVSPFLIIIVALTGLASFAIPDFSLSFHIRISRFVYIILGYSLGFLGIAIAMFVQFSVLSSMKSFGVPYLAPYAPIMNKEHMGYLVSPIWKRDHRADFLNSKKKFKEDKISMKWKTQ